MEETFTHDGKCRFTMTSDDCVLCAGKGMDDALMRTEVWSDDLWRLTTARYTEVAGFSYLEPRRHIADITEMDGAEAASFGPTIAAASKAIRDSTGADLIYVYVFGDGVPHLHVHLAPHRTLGSPLVSEMIKGARHKTMLPSGVEVWVSDRYPLVDPEIADAAITDIQTRLSRAERSPVDSPPPS
jgi:diadenosine tetraphosphate (Ap4A) HIT family hydrolase